MSTGTAERKLIDINKEAEDFYNYLNERVSKGTRDLYFDAVCKWFNKDNELTPESAQKYIDNMKLTKSPSTIGIRGHAIMRYFKLKKMKVELELPTLTQPNPEYTKIDEVQKLIDNCHSQLEKTMIIVLFDSAVRIMELVNIEVKDVHEETLTMTVIRKGGSITDVNLSERAMNELLLFIGVRGITSGRVFGGMNYQKALKVIHGVGARAGIFLHPHMLRHGRAIDALNKGTEPYVVQQMLAHKTLATTMNVYARFTVLDLKKKIPAW